MPPTATFDAFRDKMDAAGLSTAAINAFERNYALLLEGRDLRIREDCIRPATGLPRLEEVHSRKNWERDTADALSPQTVLIKVNGGLGTGMGLERPKSLLMVREGMAFLDLIARQILDLRSRHGEGLQFLLMNSYSTSTDTLKYLEKYPGLGGKNDLELMQNRVPKIDAATLNPVSFPDQPELEWCPPGHGDLYPSLLGTGWLDLLLAKGIRYVFVSNADNLGATLDFDLLGYFADSRQDFMMEVTPRTAVDRKGGHLAADGESGHLLLRELAQCREEDQDAFQDIGRHRFFNTNNLWFRLDSLKAVLDRNHGILPLPMIKNVKSVDPRDPGSKRVFQLETAMGAAIECFENAGAVVVPRSRFAPVKTTEDLLALRSDAYVTTGDFRIELHPDRGGVPPVVRLDGAHYKFAEQLDAALKDGVPSLRDCARLEVEGPVSFSSKVTFRGSVKIKNVVGKRKKLPSGAIEDRDISL